MTALPTAADSSAAEPGARDGDAAEHCHSAIEPLDPTVLGSWLVSARQTKAELRLVDCSPVVKVVVQAPPAGRLAQQLGVGVGRAELFEDGFLALCTAPGEWQLLCPSDPAEFLARFAEMAPGEPVGVVDLTHGRTLLRLTGPAAPTVLALLTALDLSERGFPLGAATTAAVAGVRTCVVRDDLFADEAGVRPPDSDTAGAGGVEAADTESDGGAAAGDRRPFGAGPDGGKGVEEAEAVPDIRSYLLCCDRSAGRYLHEQLLEAGRSHGLAEEGYLPYRERRADV